MAAMDGNSGPKDAREIDPSSRSEQPRRDAEGSPDAEDLDAPANAENDAGDAEIPLGDDDDTGKNVSGNFLSGYGLAEETDSPADQETEAIWAEEAQLSSPQGVPEGMGTIALERIPLDEQSARLAGSRLPVGLAANLGQMTDAEIMQRAGTGDEACLEFLIAKYRRPIISFMYRMVHNQAVAEELAQEVFLRVYRARATYRAEARFSTWLYRIASNMAINYARDTKYERASASIFLDQADEETGTKPDVADLRPLADQDMLQDERMRRIREHVMALPERQRMAVVMHKYQDMDYKQIGAVLKLSESATKSLLFRAYQSLREKLKEFA
jgi:RNA polymerase sigma-70 factor (ECF subfamily)